MSSVSDIKLIRTDYFFFFCCPRRVKGRPESTHFLLRFLNFVLNIYNLPPIVSRHIGLFDSVSRVPCTYGTNLLDL